MANVLRIAIVDPNDDTRENLKTVLLGLDTVWLEADCSRYEFFPDVIEQTKPDIALVAMDSDPERAVQLVAEVAGAAPECTLLVSSSSTDGRLILESMRAGAKEYLTEPLKAEDLASALQRVKRQLMGEHDTKVQGCKVVAIGGATGRIDPGGCAGICFAFRGSSG